jgi:hypothetical protein
VSAITQAIYTRMIADATLIGLLGSYGGAPSVHTQRPLPPGFDIAAHGPYILSVGEVTAVPGPNDVKNARGRELIRDIHCFADLAVDSAVVEAIAERVRFLFHRQTSVAVSGYAIVVAEASGPITLDEEDAHGRVVSVRWALQES